MPIIYKIYIFYTKSLYFKILYLSTKQQFRCIIEFVNAYFFKY